MNYLEELGTYAVGSRVKNLSELMMRDISKIYKDHNIDFEPRWFTFFQIVLHKKEISVTEIATELNLSHPAVVQVANVLEKKKLVLSGKDSKDKRKRLFRLSRKGKKLAEELEPLWDKIREAAEELLAESAPDLMDQIANVEKALQHKNMYQRVHRKLIMSMARDAEVIDFEGKYSKAFRELNEAWLSKYLDISPHDSLMLSDPQKQIIGKKGRISLLVSHGQLIGTYVLKRFNEKDCELSKFTIKQEFRGIGLGKKLLSHAIASAKNMGCQTLVLFTHKKLEEATSLYLRAGFQRVDQYPGLTDHSGRCSQIMKFNIQ